MKRLSLVIFFLFTVLLAAQIQVMSYNIRLDHKGDGDNWWGYRKGEVVALMDFYAPDIMGLQEVLPQQYQFLNLNLKAYTPFGYGRDGRGTESESVPIYFKKNLFRVADSLQFWLSETPYRVSKGWDAALNRSATYLKLEHKKSRQTYHVLNVHFDHVGKLARKNASKQILSFINAKSKKKTDKWILLGDFNLSPESEPIQTLSESLEDGYTNSDKVYGPEGTFNGFNTKKILERRIDYVFGKNIIFKSLRHIDDRRINNLYPSDHLPVLAEVD